MDNNKCENCKELLITDKRGNNVCFKCGLVQEEYRACKKCGDRLELFIDTNDMDNLACRRCGYYENMYEEGFSHYLVEKELVGYQNTFITGTEETGGGCIC